MNILFYKLTLASNTYSTVTFRDAWCSRMAMKQYAAIILDEHLKPNKRGVTVYKGSIKALQFAILVSKIHILYIFTLL